MLQFWCLSPVRVAYHGSFRENLKSAFWCLGLPYHKLIKHKQVSKAEQLKCCSIDCLSPVRVAYHGSFRENLESAFWGLGLSFHNLIKHMRVFKREQLKCCSFDASPQSEWLIMAHLERIWNQHFGVFECHIAAWLGRCTSSSNGHLWNVAVLVPLPSQSGLSRLI